MSDHHPILLSIILFILLSVILFLYLQNYTSDVISDQALRVTLLERSVESGDRIRGIILGKGEITIMLLSKKSAGPLVTQHLTLTEATSFSLPVPQDTPSGSYIVRVKGKQTIESLVLISKSSPKNTQLIPITPPPKNGSQKMPTPPITPLPKIPLAPLNLSDILLRARHSANPREICGEMEDRESYETCLAYSTTSNGKTCGTISDVTLRDHCYASVAVVQGDTSLCEQISSRELRMDCEAIT